MNILGISALYHDSAVALVRDGEIVAAAQEERFSRKKHDSRVPVNAIKYCLKEAGIGAEELDYVVYYDNPFLTLDRWMKNILALGEESINVLHGNSEKMFAQKMWIHEHIKQHIPSLGNQTKFLVTKHHVSHAASAFYPSPYKNAIVITLDGVGEWTTLSIGVGRENKLEIKEELRYPHSLGLFYSAFTYFCGFKVNSGDYKFMGLAPYGKPIYCDKIYENIIHVKADGSFRLNLEYFDYQNGRTMINAEKFAELFDGKRRKPESKITQREMDIAASVQKITEEIICRIVSYAKQTWGKNIDNLVMAGGVALNCVANGKLLKSNIFKNIWIQPAAGDAGGALGAALYVYFDKLNNKRHINEISDNQKGSYLGPCYSSSEIKKFLDENNCKFHKENDIAKKIATLLEEQKIIGLFNGRMEYGPRALGHRSIIADPRSDEMQVRLNLKIKFRESFRPFAPSVLRERVDDYFEMNTESPYMLLCADVKQCRREKFDVEKLLHETDMDMLPVVRARRSDIPAVTHVDYSARIQTVDGKWNPLYYRIIKEFEKLTGCGVIVNTSFNVRGEPIVCTPQDAYLCFMRSDMDVLVLENYILYKDEQDKLENDEDWRNIYELD